MRTALGIADAADPESTEAVAGALHRRRVLLVVDACEHVVAASAELVGLLLRRCPNLRVLVTSREPLDVEGETVVRVEPLAVAEHATDGSGSLSDAARLFLERARAAVPNLRLSAGEVAVVEDVCRRLDGIPLAIELAAARLSVLSVAQVLERLEDRFRLLTGAPRGALARRQTLRATLDWSWELLSSPERALFAHLSVFRGSFDLRAVEAIVPLNNTAEPLDLLSQLVRKSLVAAATAGQREARYTLLDTVRAYAAERLQERGERDAAEEAHAAFFLSTAERAAADLHGPHQVEWLKRLDAEHDNIRAALDRLTARGHVVLAQRLGAAVWWYWVVRGLFAEGAERLDRLLALAGEGAGSRDGDLSRGRALVGAVYLTFRMRIPGRGVVALLDRVEPLVTEAVSLFRRHGDIKGEAHARSVLGSLAAIARSAVWTNEPWVERCAVQLETGLSLARAAEDGWLTALALNMTGVVTRHRGNLSRARDLLEEALALRRSIGDTWGIAASLSDLGHLAHAEGDDVTAEARYRESLTIRRDLGDALGLMASLLRLANFHVSAGDYSQARELLDECEPIARRAFTPVASTWLLALRGMVACGQGEYETAQRQLTAALREAEARNFSQVLLLALEGAAQLAVARGQWRRALRLAGATLARAASQGEFGPTDRAAIVRALTPAREALGADAAAAVQAEGATWTLDEAVEQALSGEESAAPAQADAAAPARNGRSGAARLSSRELEVAALVTQGMTNPQIAARLVISERTAARHVEHILNKLAFATRAQIAAWVVERRLVEHSRADEVSAGGVVRLARV